MGDSDDEELRALKKLKEKQAIAGWDEDHPEYKKRLKSILKEHAPKKVKLDGDGADAGPKNVMWWGSEWYAGETKILAGAFADVDMPEACSTHIAPGKWQPYPGSRGNQTYRRFILAEKGGYRHARFKMVADGIILTEGTPRAEYGPRALRPHDLATAGDEADEEEEAEPPAPAPAAKKKEKAKKTDIKKPDPKKPASTGKKRKDPPAEPSGKDAEEEEEAPVQGRRPKRAGAGKK